ncbi:MAG: uncharacterized protein PWP15_701 [Methanothermococcus sp.]|nr:uncharacterized protein [Methanothermococcus sp.]MDK2987204.1 uncharacterized protein [Methanothermococcus sp.]
MQYSSYNYMVLKGMKIMNNRYKVQTARSLNIPLDEVTGELCRSYMKILSMVNQSKENRNTPEREFDICLFRFIRCIPVNYLGNVDMEVGSLLYSIGKQFGRSLSLSSVWGFIEYCKCNNVGYIEIISENPLKIRINDCITCTGLPNVGKTLCDFEGGFIAGCFENILCKKVLATETHCIGLGDDFCQYDVKIQDP